ncbi:hypothetical protein BFP97_12370 [Roseivirga sp. 4D4]|uniref:DinB family protein n=1 Tax=Roseivirga sp. 4D4 TaxID=1889784 RepID=UPI000852EB14|nr:DinB family protein [Roseivirga sp. 4D4]OEK02263.1 hypothetical protein BFP97_12370 [Roseivirga sp. 4D4]
MNKEIESVEYFFHNEVPDLLQNLAAETKPVWGLMTPQHMLEHLIVTFKMSIGRIKIPVVSAEEDFPRLKAYLMKDSPMRRSVPSPTGKNELQPLRSANLDEAKTKLVKETESFLSYMKANPDAVADHPFGGPMTANEWIYFHRKHFKHHFIQFGLIPDYE